MLIENRHDPTLTGYVQIGEIVLQNEVSHHVAQETYLVVRAWIERNEVIGCLLWAVFVY